MAKATPPDNVDDLEPSKGGRPPHVPTEMSRRIVRKMCVWANQPQIADMLDIGEGTLRKYYKRELQIGKLEAHDAVYSTFLLNCVGGPNRDWSKSSVAAQIWYQKTRMGLKEDPLEITTPDGRPIQIEGDSARELIASRIASIAANLRAEGDPGRPDGGATRSPPLGLEILPAPGADLTYRVVGDMADPGGPGVREDEVGS